MQHTKKISLFKEYFEPICLFKLSFFLKGLLKRHPFERGGSFADKENLGFFASILFQEKERDTEQQKAKSQSFFLLNLCKCVNLVLAALKEEVG